MVSKTMVRNFDSDNLQQEFRTELSNILNYWKVNTVDEMYGGFIGQISDSNEINLFADKGSVLNARILWSFSAGYNLTEEPEYLLLARRSFDYIVENFIDNEYGGVYWSVTHTGAPADTRKQIYAIAFTIYALAEFYQASHDTAALELSQKLYYDIESWSYDKINGGYLEALTRDWRTIDDQRLSSKDMNEKKTMNTHLHILEAYTNLFRIWPDEKLKLSLANLLSVFIDHIIDKDSFHLNLFFDEKWNSKSHIISYGHDIEASWLLLEAALVLNDIKVIDTVMELTISIADAASQGLDKDGSMYYEFDPSHGQLVKQKHWWVQAEALVGFMNAWQLTSEDHYMLKITSLWSFIKKFIVDHNGGEWYWGLEEDNSVMVGQDKVGLWKCPYHNSRGCIEMLKRLRTL